MLAAGGMCLFLSGEVCLRLYKKTKKVLDPDLDNIANPHEVKHWMDPKLIPFGWGLFEVDDEIIVIEKGNNNNESLPETLIPFSMTIISSSTSNRPQPNGISLGSIQCLTS